MADNSLNFDPTILLSIDDPSKLSRYIASVQERLKERMKIDPNEDLQPTVKLIGKPDADLKSNYWTHQYSIPVPSQWRWDDENEFKLTYRVHKDFSNEQHELINDSIEYLSKNVWIRDWHGVKTDPRDFDEYPFYDDKLKEVRDDGGDYSALNFAIFLAFWHYPNDPDYSNKNNLLVIHRFDQQPENGEWTLGLGEINAFDYLRHCEIELNGTAMGSNSDYHLSTSPAKWAGTILHECFHNFGWRHIQSEENAIMVGYANRVSGNV